MFDLATTTHTLSCRKQLIIHSIMLFSLAILFLIQITPNQNMQLHFNNNTTPKINFNTLLTPKSSQKVFKNDYSPSYNITKWRQGTQNGPKTNSLYSISTNTLQNGYKSSYNITKWWLAFTNQKNISFNTISSQNKFQNDYTPSYNITKWWASFKNQRNITFNTIPTSIPAQKVHKNNYKSSHNITKWLTEFQNGGRDPKTKSNQRNYFHRLATPKSGQRVNQNDYKTSKNILKWLENGGVGPKTKPNVKILNKNGERWHQMYENEWYKWRQAAKTIENHITVKKVHDSDNRWSQKIRKINKNRVEFSGKSIDEMFNYQDILSRIKNNHQKGLISSKFVDQKVTHSCSNDYQDIIQKYFNSRLCTTLIQLSNISYNPDIYFQLIKMPRKVLKYDQKFEMADVKIRPRRDPYFSDGIIKTFCQGDFEGFVILAETLEEVYRYAFGAKVSPFLSAQSKFLVVVEEEVIKEHLEVFYERIWKIFKAPRVVVVQGCNIYFYNPFEKGLKWGKVVEYGTDEVKLEPGLIENHLQLINSYPFKSIIFYSLMAYTIFQNDTYVDYGGMDGKLLDLLAEYMNFTKVLIPKIPKSNYGERKENGSFDGALKYLLEGTIDFISVSYFLKDYLTRDVEFSAVGMQDDLCVVVHKGGQIPILEIFYVYYDVWLILFITYFIITFVWILIQKFSTFVDPTNPKYPVPLDTLRLMIAFSFSRVPKILSEKIFLTSCMMAFITFLGAFQGSLITILSTPSYYPDIKTLEMLSEKPWPIYTRFEAIKNDVFGDDSTNPTTVKLRKMVEINKQKFDSDYMIAKYGNCAGLVRRSSLELENKTMYFDSSGNDILYLVDECPRGYSLAYLLPRKSCFAPRVDDLVLRTSQAGLFFKWYRDMAFNTSLSTRPARLARIALERDNQQRGFGMDELVMGFYIMGIGYAAGSAVLVVEVVYWKVKTRRKGIKN